MPFHIKTTSILNPGVGDIYYKEGNTWTDVYGDRKVFDSESDFILVETKPKILKLINELLEFHNIYIREISNKFKDGKTYFRFAVRTSYENKLVIEKITSLIN